MGDDLRFVKFIEYNEHEGESWVFWLQSNGNEDALNELAYRLEDEGHGEEFELDQNTVLSEHEVDVLVEHGNVSDYMNMHTKVTSVMTIPEDDGEDLDQQLYKGRIAEWFGQNQPE